MFDLESSINDSVNEVRARVLLIPKILPCDLYIQNLSSLSVNNPSNTDYPGREVNTKRLYGLSLSFALILASSGKRRAHLIVNPPATFTSLRRTSQLLETIAGGCCGLLLSSAISFIYFTLIKGCSSWF
ncbi:hypothetical protein NMG60_11025491 [Bertholletia excelsa]